MDSYSLDVALLNDGRIQLSFGDMPEDECYSLDSEAAKDLAMRLMGAIKRSEPKQICPLPSEN